MRRVENRVFYCVVGGATLLSLVVLAFVIFFITKEALPIFQVVTPIEFLTGDKWMPIDFTGTGTSFGIRNFFLATVAVSLMAMLISVVVGLGAAVWLSCVASEQTRNLLYPVIDLLAGIPSVIYGFVGLTVLVKIFLKAGVHTGSCVLAASFLLSIMLLPFFVSSCSDTILKVKNRYLASAEALGISLWYGITTIVLPCSLKNVLMSMVLSIGRAMGETMAVMMVVGNANLMPHLLGKSETIAAVIALEMGTAVADSDHYHALYAAGFVLMLILFAINIVMHLLHNRLADQEVF